jgi:hypothetical protein
MPATRSRTSTEQPAEVATEEVKQQQEPTEPAVSPPVEQEEVKEAEAVVTEPTVETPAVVEETNSTAEAVPENGTEAKVENGTAALETTEAEAAEAEPAVAESVADKRKSEVVGGEGDGPDSTEVVAKKAKVDEEEPTTEAVAEAAPVEASA